MRIPEGGEFCVGLLLCGVGLRGDDVFDLGDEGVGGDPLAVVAGTRNQFFFVEFGFEKIIQEYLIIFGLEGVVTSVGELEKRGSSCCPPE